MTIFSQFRNAERDIEAIADGYKNRINHEFWLADGLQKDAIQNSWDARIDKKNGKNWRCTFSIKKIANNHLLSITDEGTKGLLGTKFSSVEELKEILLSNRKNEDLAYFLNSNWSVKSADEGGTRGRGKTLFLAASKNKKIFFDSRRSDDGAYVFGELYLDSDKDIKYKLFWDKEAEAELGVAFNGALKPLKKAGTRILILNPDSKIEESVKGGQLIGFISGSYWELIKKFSAKIIVDDGDELKSAPMPKWYEDVAMDGVEHREYSSELIKTNTLYRSRKMVLRYAPGDLLPEAVKGVAIQRGGMTVERLSSSTLVKEGDMGCVYGWIEMDHKPLEADMKKCEGPEHFDFDWRPVPASYLHQYIKNKLREFAKDLKIIESEQTKKDKIKKSAEERAIRSLAPLFKRLGLSGRNFGNKHREKSKRKDNEPIRLSAQDFKLPGVTKRVNFGQKIEGAYVVPINESSKSILVLVRVYIARENEIVEVIAEREIILHPGRGAKIGSEVLDISKNYKPGGYSLKAKMIALEDVDMGDALIGGKIEKGQILYDRINQKFYVEVDPPESGPFRFEPFSKNDKKLLFGWDFEGDGYVITYNDLHPKIRSFSSDEDNLSNYLMEQAALIALQIKLEDATSDGDKEGREFWKLKDTKDPTKALPALLGGYSEFLWDHLEEQYGNQIHKKE